MKIKQHATYQQIGEKKIKREIKKYLETTENGNRAHQNLSDAAKTVLRKKFTVINAYIKKKERPHIHNLTLHHKGLERKKQTKPKVSRRKEIIKIRVEIN